MPGWHFANSSFDKIQVFESIRKWLPFRRASQVQAVPSDSALEKPVHKTIEGNTSSLNTTNPDAKPENPTHYESDLTGVESISANPSSRQANVSSSPVTLIVPRELIVHFESGSYELDFNSMEELQIVPAILRQEPNLYVLLLGYSDSIGHPRHNLLISLSRANIVKTYLKRKGVDPERIKVKGLGSSNPVAPNALPEGRRLNRRVEIKFMYDLP
jgi:outer membrane protein OmpA-like peptidoglycan-associated protein